MSKAVYENGNMCCRANATINYNYTVQAEFAATRTRPISSSIVKAVVKAKNIKQTKKHDDQIRYHKKKNINYINTIFEG